MGVGGGERYRAKERRKREGGGGIKGQRKQDKRRLPNCVSGAQVEMDENS